VAVVLDLVQRIDAALHDDAVDLAVGTLDGDGDIHARLDAAGDAGDVEDLRAVQLQRLARHAVLELQRQHAHADEVRAVDALEALDHHGLDAEQPRALRRPVARRAGAVFLAGDDDQRHAILLVAHRRVVDRHLLARRLVPGDAAARLPGTISFLMRMLAKVPRIITSWLPRRVPYWLKSCGAPGARAGTRPPANSS
jgi:hypothetical protein